ncbi:MAG TPA: hypothetical protein VGX46_16265 [Vicinamibacterales bacterium]|nr:hypothetical protein [Vicinamibacterales bacterium]
MSFSHTAIIPVWLLVFALFVLFESPMTLATGVLLLVGGIALPITLVRWKQLPPGIPAMATPPPPLATLPSTAFVPNSWPDSGFRNMSQRRTRS